MNLKQKEERIEQLEEKARKKFIELTEWGEIVSCLTEKEIDEYYSLMKQVYDMGI